MTITTAESVRTRATETNAVLSFGAVRFQSDGGHDYYAKGWIHWCKIWWADLGAQVATKLASWPHETLRMEFVGDNRYRIAGSTSVRANGSFLANNPLALWKRMNASNTNAGGWEESEMRDFCNTRVFEALDYGWQSMIKRVKIFASAGSQSYEIITSEDAIYLASTREVGGYSGTPYTGEGDAISFYSSNRRRLKFCGIIIPDSAQFITEASDPTALTSYTISEGDVWINSDSSVGYIYVSQATKNRHSILGGRATDSTDNVAASDGGLWGRANTWWLRSPYVGNSTYFCNVYGAGGAGYYNASNTYGLVPGFSI